MIEHSPHHSTATEAQPDQFRFAQEVTRAFDCSAIMEKVRASSCCSKYLHELRQFGHSVEKWIRTVVEFAVQHGVRDTDDLMPLYQKHGVSENNSIAIAHQCLAVFACNHGGIFSANKNNGDITNLMTATASQVRLAEQPYLPER